MLAVAHVQIIPPKEKVGSALLNVDSEVVVVIGVMNGDTAPLAGLVPVELVSLGVANAGEATTTRADATTSAARTPSFNAFI